MGRASVEARNLAVGSALETSTDGAGRFRFAALTPGAYDVTASLDGFRPTRFERVEILLGQIKRLDFILLVGPATETVNASAASPLLDVTQSAHGFSLREDQLAYLPRGPDYTSVLRQLPGTSLEPEAWRNLCGRFERRGKSLSHRRHRHNQRIDAACPGSS